MLRPTRSTSTRSSGARSGRWRAAPAQPPSPIGGWCSLEEDREGKLPIDDSDGGCDCQPQCKQGKAWTRQHPAIRIDDADFISDNGQEVYNYFVEHGIKNILYMGVHTNMCVLGPLVRHSPDDEAGLQDAIWCAT